MKEVPYPEIPYSEYKSRTGKARELMENNHVHAILITHHDDLKYFFGCPTSWMPVKNTMYTMGGIIPLDGEPVLIVPYILGETVNKCCWVKNIKVHGGGRASTYYAVGSGYPEHAAPLFIESIKELGLTDKVIGIELDEKGRGLYMSHMHYKDFNIIKDSLPSTRFVDSADQIWEQRKIKSAYEIGIMRKVAEIATKGIKAAFESLREGMTERGLLRIMWETFVAEGAYDTPMRGMQFVYARPRKERSSLSALELDRTYGLSSVTPLDRPLKRGEQIYTDGGPCYKWYSSDVQRQACIGEPPELQRKLFEQSLMAEEAALAALQPGTKICDIYAGVGEKMKEIGVDRIFEWTTLIGHSIGIAAREYPLITAEEKSMLEPGMVMCVEVSRFDIPEWRVLGGYPEEMVLITENGYENLTAGFPRDLYVAR